MSLDWTALGVVCAVLIAIGGGLAKLISYLVKVYFITLTARMDGFDQALKTHIEEETKYQDKVTELLGKMKDSLTRMETSQTQYVTVASLLDARRQIDQQITDSRHSVMNHMTPLIAKQETALAEIKSRVDILEDHDSQD